MRGAFKEPSTERFSGITQNPAFAPEPHRPEAAFAASPGGAARNATAGVQDWSVGPTYPLSVTVVGNPHAPETVRYVAMDLHDATAIFEGRQTYADAYCDAVSYLAVLKRYGSRERLRLVRNLHATKGAVNWAAIALGPPIEYDDPPLAADPRMFYPVFNLQTRADAKFATVKPEDA